MTPINSSKNKLNNKKNWIFNPMSNAHLRVRLGSAYYTESIIDKCKS